MFGKKERTENKKSGNGIVWKLLGCLIIAAALFAVLLNVESNVLSDYEKKMTVICKEQIPMGTRITETNAEQYFETYEIDVKIVSENAVIDKSELIGTVAARTMDAGELVKNDDFTKESGIYAKYQEPVEASFKAEHPGDVVSGSIRSGDFVDIAVVDKDTLEYEKNRVVMIEEKGIKFAFLSYTYATNIPSAAPVVVNYRDIVRIKEDNS